MANFDTILANLAVAVARGGKILKEGSIAASGYNPFAEGTPLIEPPLMPHQAAYFLPYIQHPDSWCCAALACAGKCRIGMNEDAKSVVKNHLRDIVEKVSRHLNTKELPSSESDQTMFGAVEIAAITGDIPLTRQCLRLILDKEMRRAATMSACIALNFGTGYSVKSIRDYLLEDDEEVARDWYLVYEKCHDSEPS